MNRGTYLLDRVQEIFRLAQIAAREFLVEDPRVHRVREGRQGFPNIFESLTERLDFAVQRSTGVQTHVRCDLCYQTAQLR